MSGVIAVPTPKCAVLATSRAAATPCSLPATAWLAQSPRGAYTTARTVGGNAVFELSFHIDRLASSARLMMQADLAAGQSASGRDDVLQQHAALVDPALLRPAVLRSMRSAVAGYRALCPGDASSELKLTVLVTWSPQGGTETEEVCTHAQALGARPAPPIKVQVRGAPRANAAAKDSEWVRQRQVYEAQRPADVEEVVLADPGGALLEGLSSNFMVLQGGALRTAGEGVLAGSVRAAALRVAPRFGLQVDLRPPALADAGAWEGAFLSSTSRLLLPIDELSAPNQDPPVVYKFARSPLVEQLEAGVAAEVAACSEPLE